MLLRILSGILCRNSASKNCVNRMSKPFQMGYVILFKQLIMYTYQIKY